jgi:hypothetical protein
MGRTYRIFSVVGFVHSQSRSYFTTVKQPLLVNDHNRHDLNLRRRPNSTLNSWTCLHDIILSTIFPESDSYITTDGQSASLSWTKAPIWGLRPDFYCRQTVAGLLMWGTLFEERTGMSFTIAAGPRQRSHFRVRNFPFRRLLRLAGLRWRYSTTSPQGISFHYMLNI